MIGFILNTEDIYDLYYMINNRKKFTYNVIALVVFWIAAIISIWRLIAEEPTLVVIIPAICFPVAAIGMTISVFRIRKLQKMNRDI